MIIDFIQPITQKELKKFLGLATYFSSHIRDYSNMTKSLRDMTLNYNPKQKLTWNEDSISAFNNVKQAINNCPTLYS